MRSHMGRVGLPLHAHCHNPSHAAMTNRNSVMTVIRFMTVRKNRIYEARMGESGKGYYRGVNFSIR
jgi:hypothetical protein